jgi:hypothetical protein
LLTLRRYEIVRYVKRERVLAAIAALFILACVSAAGALAKPVVSTTAAVWCAGGQSWAGARSAAGSPFRVKGRVSRVYYASSTAGKPTFIDLGAPYPNSRRLSIVIWGRDRANFPSPPERMFRRGTMICAQGFVEMYRGVPQIEVSLWDAAGRVLTF